MGSPQAPAAGREEGEVRRGRVACRQWQVEGADRHGLRAEQDPLLEVSAAAAALHPLEAPALPLLRALAEALHLEPGEDMLIQLTGPSSCLRQESYIDCKDERMRGKTARECSRHAVRP